MSLDNATIQFMSAKITEIYTGLQISKHASTFCISNGYLIHLPEQGRMESKAKYVNRIFSSFEETDIQIGFILYIVSQSKELQSDSNVQKLLFSLSRQYEILAESEEAHRKLSDIERILHGFPESLALWQKSQQDYQSYQFRECLDNSRLCIELLLKDVLKNNRSIENQREYFCRWLSVKNVPNEIVNLIWKNIDDYTTLQNNHVKHNISKKLQSEEIDFILDISYAIIKFIMTKVKEKECE